MTLDEYSLGIPRDLKRYALEHPMIPLGEAARIADHLAALKARPRPRPSPRRLAARMNMEPRCARSDIVGKSGVTQSADKT